jgi:hypothetical protein
MAVKRANISCRTMAPGRVWGRRILAAEARAGTAQSNAGARPPDGPAAPEDRATLCVDTVLSISHPSPDVGNRDPAATSDRLSPGQEQRVGDSLLLSTVTDLRA